MSMTTNDWIWARLSSRYNVTAPTYQIGDVWDSWLKEQSLSQGFDLVDFYFTQVPSAATVGDAAYSYWSGGALGQAVVWLDAYSAVAGEQSAKNFGVGSTAYAARYGSATGSDTNDPLLLPHTGTNYVHVPLNALLNGISVTVTPSTIVGSGAVELQARALVYATSAELLGTSATNLFGLYVSAGNLQLGLTVGGINRFMNLGACTTGSVMYYRATFDPATGVANGFQSTDGLSWTSTGTQTVAAGAISVFTGFLYMGSIGFGVGGDSAIYAAKIITAGITTLDFVANRDFTSGATTSFTLGSGQAATITRATSGRKAVAVVRPVWLFGTDDYMEIPADPEGAYVTTTGTSGSYISTPYQSLVTGTATSATATTLVDTAKTWTVNAYVNYQVRITGGTGVGQRRRITANTVTDLTVAAWTVTPDATSTYIIESAFNILSDLDVAVRVAGKNWAAAFAGRLVSKSSAVPANATWDFFASSGFLGFNYSTGAAFASITSSVTVPFVDNTTYWVRLTVDVDNGAGGADIAFYYAADSATVPSSWTQIGTTRTLGAVLTLNNGSDPLVIGDRGSADRSFNGVFYRAIVRDGIGGSIVADWAAYGHPSSKETYVDGYRNVWSINGAGTTITGANKLNFGSTDSFTIVAVVRRWGTPSTAFQRIVDKLSGVPSTGYAIFNNGTTLQPLLFTSSDGTQYYASGNTPTSGVLNVITGVCNRTTNLINLYQDTAAAATLSIAGVGSLSTAIPLRIAAATGGGGVSDMELLAVAVIPKALTAAEITAICKLYGTA